MSNEDNEGAALARESARAVRHFFVLWFGFPALVGCFAVVVSKVSENLGDGNVLRAVLLMCVGGTLTFLFGKWLWRVVKR